MYSNALEVVQLQKEERHFEAGVKSAEAYAKFISSIYAAGGATKTSIALGGGIIKGTANLAKYFKTQAASFSPKKVKWIDSQDIPFSQDSISFAKKSKGEIHYTFEDVYRGIQTEKWVGDPIDLVIMRDGKLTSIDNTRAMAAQKLNQPKITGLPADYLPGRSPQYLHVLEEVWKEQLRPTF